MIMRHDTGLSIMVHDQIRRPPPPQEGIIRRVNEANRSPKTIHWEQKAFPPSILRGRR